MVNPYQAHCFWCFFLSKFLRSRQSSVEYSYTVNSFVPFWGRFFVTLSKVVGDLPMIGDKKGHFESPGTPLKINMEHNHARLGRSCSFLNWWLVGSILIFQGVVSWSSLRCWLQSETPARWEELLLHTFQLSTTHECCLDMKHVGSI